MIEIAIAIVLLSFIVAAVTPVMVLIVNTQVRHDEEQIANNLTRAQFEYIKSQEYKWGYENWPVTYDVVVPDVRYGVDVDVWPIDPDTHAALDPGLDEGVQEITISVYGYSLDPQDEPKFLLRTIDYKVARSLAITGYEVSG